MKSYANWDDSAGLDAKLVLANEASHTNHLSNLTNRRVINHLFGASDDLVQSLSRRSVKIRILRKYQKSKRQVGKANYPKILTTISLSNFRCSANYITTNRL